MVAISIIIPVFNSEGFLHECLDSLVNQTFKDFEIICVNDGSTDSSLKILENYAQKDSRFKIITQENQGAGSARNNGLKYAKGEFVQFLDCDDYFEQTLLEDLYNKAKDFNADLVVCSCKKVDEFGNVIENSNPQWPIKVDVTPINKTFNWKIFPETILDMFCVIPWNKLYKKDLLTQNNIEFQNLSSSNDVAFGHKVKICAEKIVVFEKQLINYRYNHKKSISKTRAENTINIIHSAKEVKDFLIKKGLYENLEKTFIETYKNHIRAEISLCNEEEYTKFKNKFKALYPEFFETFSDVLKYDFLTLDYLNNFIKNKQVYLWGASNFLKKLLEKEERPNPNIMGIIDKNEASWEKDFGNYKIYSPEILETNPASILVTVYNNNEKAYENIKKELYSSYPRIKVLKNIFLKSNSDNFDINEEILMAIKALYQKHHEEVSQDFLKDEYEIMACKTFFEEMKSFDKVKKYKKLINNLDNESIECVSTVLARIEKIATAKEKSIDIFSGEEISQIKKIKKDFYDKCFCLDENCYAYKQYLLPIKHFEPSVLYYKHNINLVDNIDKIRNKAIIDVGAFIGDSAIILQEYTENKVYSFEPTQQNFSLLLKTIELNNAEKIIPQKYALGSKKEQVEIYLQGSASSINRKLNDYAKKEKINIITLDDFVDSNNIEVGLIKVDIEGFEQDFLKGAINTIIKQKPILLFSIYHNAKDFFDIKPYIESLELGYKFKIVKPIDGSVRGEILLIAEVKNTTSDKDFLSRCNNL